jgi:HEAT repeat protein
MDATSHKPVVESVHCRQEHNVSRYLAFAAVLVGAASTSAAAQTSIAQRVARAPDGIVRVQYASRAGACGDGRDMIGLGHAFFMESMQSYGGHWTADQCKPGPVRVALSVAGGRVTQMKAYVGGSWSGGSRRITDLGVIPSAAAAEYFFGLVPQLDRGGKRDRLLLPAVLADDPGAVQRLMLLARDAARTRDTRRESIQWMGLLGDASVVPTLVGFVRQAPASPASADDDDDEDDEGPGEEGIGTAAIGALSFVQNHAGIPALIDFARGGQAWARRSAVFWLGQSGDPRALAVLHTIIENPKEADALRSRAIFSLSHGDSIPAAEFAYLRNIYPRLASPRLKEAILMGMSEERSGSGKWLLEKARDRSESLESRKKAIFWLGQAKSTATTDLADFYRTTSEPELREHAIFVLSQRDDEAAMNELLRIARDDSDKRMRAKAMFWLAQKDDPRVAKLISDRVSH